LDRPVQPRYSDPATATSDAPTKGWAHCRIDEPGPPPGALLFMLSAIGRMAGPEEAFGTRTGHDKGSTSCSPFLDTIEPTALNAGGEG
jgi:hypothetical protein